MERLQKDLRELLALFRSNDVDFLIVGGDAVALDDAWASKVAGEIDGSPVWFIDRESLLRNKRATGRPQDLADVDFVERLH